MGSNPNSMDIQAVWDTVYQLTHYKQPVYKAFATERLASKLKSGDTVHRTYSSDFTVNNMGGDGSYSTQALTDSDETLVVNQKKEVSFYIPEWQELQFHLPTRVKFARKAMNRLFNQIDGDLLGSMYQNATTAIDDGSLGGTSGNGITVGIGNVANLFYYANQALQLQNVMYDPNAMFSGNVKLDKTKIMPVAAISPQVYNVLMQFLGGKNSALGDKVSTNGHAGTFAGWNLFVSNNLGWTGTLAIATQPTDGDTVTINGVVLTFKTTLGSTAGNVLIGASAATANTNITRIINTPGTTDTLAVALSAANQALLANFSSTAASTSSAVVATGWGSVVVSDTLTAAADGFTTTLQKQHCLFGVSGSIDLIMQKTPNLVINPVSGKVGKDFVTWNLYGYKVFTEQKPQLVDVQINASSFTAPSNTFN